MAAQMTSIPCTLMRGGTSKGPYFHTSDLPEDRDQIAQILLAVMGSPDVRQIDGIGGADTLTSKVAIVGPSTHADAQVDYLFAQVSIDKAVVDFGPSCGNMLSGVGPFAIEAGLVNAVNTETTVTVHNVNTGAIIDTVVKTENGMVIYQGDASIDGVPGTAAPIMCRYRNIAGSKTGSMLPTGNAIDVIDGVEATLIDVATPMMMLRASDLGIAGNETREQIDANRELMQRVEQLRLQAGEMIGFGDVRDKVLPKVALLSEPRNGGSITSRYLTPLTCHAAHAVTGGLCVASCCKLAGSVADGLVNIADAAPDTVVIEHPSGTLEIEISTKGEAESMEVLYGGVMRTARKLFAGDVFIPART